MFTLSPEFDIEYYKNNYPELKHMRDEMVIEHYKRFGEKQGRTCCSYDRSEYLKSAINELIANNPIKVLEIGPFDNPACINSKENRGTVKYFDVLDIAELAKRAERHDRHYNKLPDKIDYVSPIGDLSIIDEQFDIVFSNHVIEHQINLIKHFQMVADILNDDGLYILVVPDKRYCFDHFLPETTVSELIDDYANDINYRPFKDVLDEYFLHTHNNMQLHWAGEHGSPGKDINFDELVRITKEYEKNRISGKYIDIHSSQFTPKSFEHIIKTLNKLELINFEIHRLCHTVFGRCEFCAVLKKI